MRDNTHGTSNHSAMVLQIDVLHMTEIECLTQYLQIAGINIIKRHYILL